jgi:magnesium chelatase family protein
LIRPVRGVLPIAITARALGYEGIFLPIENAHEAAVVEGVRIYPVESLFHLVQVLRGVTSAEPFQVDIRGLFQRKSSGVDFSEVRGQENAKRALEIAAAGGHNVIMIGPPGSGKTMLARRLPSILPPLTFEESLETSKLYSVMGLMPRGHGLITERPFRAPHHTISDAGLIGGGQNPRPGEVSMSHNGVLFLDELPEFRKNVLEVLRQPMEDGHVTISRANASMTYPSAFMLVAAMNPCPCGFLGDPKRECTCALIHVQRYRSKISGPLLDRMDIHLEVPSVPYRDLEASEPVAASEEILDRVMRARSIQLERFEGKGVHTNARMTTRQLKKHCAVDEASGRLLERAMERFGLSARAHARILKIARTIADLEASSEIESAHVAEAIQYRSLDRRVIK